MRRLVYIWWVRGGRRICFSQGRALSTCRLVCLSVVCLGRTLSTCWENCRLCSVQCHCKVKPVAPSCTKLRTTWGKLKHNFRNILSCVDQSQGLKLSRANYHRQTTDRQVDFMTRPCLVKNIGIYDPLCYAILGLTTQ